MFVLGFSNVQSFVVVPYPPSRDTPGACNSPESPIFLGNAPDQQRLGPEQPFSESPEMLSAPPPTGLGRVDWLRMRLGLMKGRMRLGQRVKGGDKGTGTGMCGVRKREDLKWAQSSEGGRCSWGNIFRAVSMTSPSTPEPAMGPRIPDSTSNISNYL